MTPTAARYGPLTTLRERPVGSLVVGDLEGAAAELESVRTRYLVEFLVRLANLMPRVTFRLAWRVGARRWFPKLRGISV